jgi:hypothetical protein
LAKAVPTLVSILTRIEIGGQPRPTKKARSPLLVGQTMMNSMVEIKIAIIQTLTYLKQWNSPLLVAGEAERREKKR